MQKNNQPLLQIDELKTYFYTLDGVVRAVDGVSLAIKPGETLGLVGESGSGKSVTAHSVLRLLPQRTSKIAAGQIRFRRRDTSEEIDLATVDPHGDLIRSIRGNEIAMIFQEPMTSLSPVFTVGHQIIEAIRLHQGASAQEAREKTIEMLQAVGLGMADQLVDEYPHRLSGGQRQRAMIAMALSCRPSLLIADEPTTALDVTVQAQILDLMNSLKDRFNMAIWIITHNLGVVAEMADRVAVMYMGRVVESGDVRTIFHQPLHPYTVGLLQSIPHIGAQIKNRLVPIPGSVPDPFSIPAGCAFRTRCPAIAAHCQAEAPMIEVEPGHYVRCCLYA
ncbi:MAG: ABC transporter ATP-binding protein [Candidatus Vecturithrix sp.]|jgi:peptide/nickel transport system ATP-binding protein/oligopeptide transport system ATP-binding protein|nr:ABC transporter ATP-binding protein [Candidatus Vecturithrix sp.]